jgi:hypothetical protein
MSFLTDEDLIEMLQIQILLSEDSSPVFRERLIKRYQSLQNWVDEKDVIRMGELFSVIPIKPKISKCTSCKKTQKSIDLVCNSCYSLCLQLHEGGNDK